MEQTLTLSGIVLLIALAVRLKVTGLSRPYRGLFAYSIFVLIRNGVPPVAALFFRGWGPNGFYYSYWWAFTEVIQWLFLVILILDLCSAIFQDFPSLASFGGRIYRTALGVAIGVSLASLFLAVQRVVLTSLMLVIVALLFSLTWFRVNVRKNTLVHAAVFFIYFFAKAGIAFILQTMGLDIRGGTNTALMLVADMCILAWIVGLRPAGEQVEVRVGHRWNPEEGERLVQQLAKLNESLANRSANPARSAGGIASEQ
jgi:hypothetical protein